MRTSYLIKAGFIVLISATAFLTGCGGGGGDDDGGETIIIQGNNDGSGQQQQPDNYAIIQGNWILTIDNVLPTGMYLNQNSNQVTGTYTLVMNTFNCSGTVDGNNFVIVVVIDNPGNLTLTGTVNGNTMGGTWVQENSGNGTFTGTR